MRAAVIGAGKMGRAHAAVYARLSGVQLAGIADLDRFRANEVAARLGCESHDDLRTLLVATRPALVSIATPPSTHRNLAIGAMEGGADVLVEKPMAIDSDDARAMIAAARRLGRVLAVGHLERWNPGVVALVHRLAEGRDGPIETMRAFRWGALMPAASDVGVSLDLATHDLDLMRSLAGSPIVRVDAFGRSLAFGHETEIRGFVDFASGVRGLVDCRWCARPSLRILEVVTERRRFVIDLLARAAYVERATRGQILFARGYTRGQILLARGYARFDAGDACEDEEPRLVDLAPLPYPPLTCSDALEAELRAFVQASRSRGRPQVGGDDGLAAVVLASALVESAARGASVRVDGQAVSAAGHCVAEREV